MLLQYIASLMTEGEGDGTGDGVVDASTEEDGAVFIEVDDGVALPSLLTEEEEGDGTGETGLLASHPFVASVSALVFSPSHTTVVQPLATAELHTVQVPSGTAAHPASHPSVASPLVSNLLASQEDKAVHPLGTSVEQAVHEAPVTEMCEQS
jgi:hypothetical protein